MACILGRAPSVACYGHGRTAPHVADIPRPPAAPALSVAAAACCPRSALPEHGDGGGRGRCLHVTSAGSKQAATSGTKGFGASAKAPSTSKSGVSQTCACGSKHVYRVCCEPYHMGLAVPPDVEAALRARFCAFIKGRTEYLINTFHPDYHAFKYEGAAPGGALDQLRRDCEAAVKRFTYSRLKVLEVAPGPGSDEAYVTFQYTSVNKFNPERNIDGSIRPSSTVERSRFLRDASSGQWLFTDYTLIDYPSWMQEAKEAEERSRKLHTEAATGEGQAGDAGVEQLVAATAAVAPGH